MYYNEKFSFLPLYAMLNPISIIGFRIKQVSKRWNRPLYWAEAGGSHPCQIDVAHHLQTRYYRLRQPRNLPDMICLMLDTVNKSPQFRISGYWPSSILKQLFHGLWTDIRSSVCIRFIDIILVCIYLGPAVSLNRSPLNEKVEAQAASAPDSRADSAGVR